MGNLIGRRTPTAVYPVRNPGAPGALVSPLTAEYWVDSGTTLPAANQTGSVIAPFSSLQAAYDAAVAAGYDLVNIIAVKTSPNEDIQMAAATPYLNVIGLTESYASTNDPTSVFRNIIGAGSNLERISVVGCQFSGITQGAHYVVLRDVILSGAWILETPSATLVFENVNLTAAGTLEGNGWYITDVSTQNNFLEYFANTISVGSINCLIPASLGTNGDTTVLFNTRSKVSYPRGVLTAASTLTLSTTGVVVGSMATIDVYRQSAGADLAIANGGGGGGTLTTVAGGVGHATRVRCTYDGTNWSLQSREIFA